MADFATALVARLSADAPVSGVVGTRVYWVNRPQNSALPAIRMQTVSDPREEHLQGYNGARQTQVQVDCFATTYGAARQLAEKVITAMNSPATVAGVQFGHTKAEGPFDEGDDTAGGFIYRARLGLRVEHRLA